MGSNERKRDKVRQGSHGANSQSDKGIAHVIKDLSNPLCIHPKSDALSIELRAHVAISNTSTEILSRTRQRREHTLILT
jgi:hypothetical protein